MEASPRTQLNLDEPGPGGSVRALDDRIVIEALTIEDERAARLVRDRAQAGTGPAETVRKAIEIGARVLDSEETAANVDYVRRELQAGLGELDRRLGGTLEDGAESLAERISTAFGAERNDSVQAQIKEIVTAESRAHREALLGTLTAEDGTNPLVAMQTRIGKKLVEAEERHRQELARLREGHATEARAMQGLIGGLREEMARLAAREEGDQRVAEAEDAGTRKGRSFEERVHAALERIADGRGDVATRVGDERGEGGGKKGDVVVEIDAAAGPPSGKLVFEVKDKRLSRNDAWAELNGALAQRGANLAVLVVAGAERMPARTEPLHEYEGNKLLVAVDRDEPDELALEVAYRYARCRVLMARDGELEVDAAGVRDAAECAVSALKKAQSVKLALTGASEGVERARGGLEEMIADVRGHLARIESLIAAAE